MKILVLLLLAHIDIALALSSSSSSPSCSSSSISTATTSSTLGGSSSVHVYNNVLPTESCNVLHHAASLVGLEHKVFQRGSPSSDLIIEQALESILNELQSEEEKGGGSEEQQEQQQRQQKQQQYVEYWTRQEWRHIEAHADVDENLAKQHDLDLGMIIDDDKTTYFRYPDFGHVLYLKIGSKVRGPTCVFPNIKSGGELLSTKQENNNNKVDLITVPAVNGRLLKFVGNALHAVPRPADIWFLSFVKGSAQYTPEDEYGRSVILFNTWSNEPPKDVPISISSSSSSSCTSVSTTSDDDGGNNNNEEVEEGSSTSTTKVDVDVNTHDTWEKVFDFHDDDDDQEKENEEEGNTDGDGDGDNDDSTRTMSKVKIWLLGNERRRQYPMRTVNMYAPQNKEKIKEVFQESKQVHHVQLERGS